MIWTAVIGASVACYLIKLAGYSMPDRWFENSMVRKSTALVPIALLSALIGLWTFTANSAVSIDARIVGLAVAVVALMLRAPFLVVILSAAAVTAAVRALGWLP